ncbi:hypothetical protein Lfu02_37360 [Longispora fulva]|nr:hypothetical protein Lfu02_37360 [Longispora fulva]
MTLRVPPWVPGSATAARGTVPGRAPGTVAPGSATPAAGPGSHEDPGATWDPWLGRTGRQDQTAALPGQEAGP